MAGAGGAGAVAVGERRRHHPGAVRQAGGGAPVVGGAGDRDGLVACHLPGGRIGLGRRVAGRVYEVRILDEDGKLVRPRVLQRGFKGVRLRLRARMAVGL